METNSWIMSAFCGSALEVQNCRESPSALKFLPAENRTGLPYSQRSKAEEDGCCWQRGRQEKGMPLSGVQQPQEPAHNCRTVAEKAWLFIFYRQSHQHHPAYSVQYTLKLYEVCWASVPQKSSRKVTTELVKPRTQPASSAKASVLSWRKLYLCFLHVLTDVHMQTCTCL